MARWFAGSMALLLFSSALWGFCANCPLLLKDKPVSPHDCCPRQGDTPAKSQANRCLVEDSTLQATESNPPAVPRSLAPAAMAIVAPEIPATESSEPVAVAPLVCPDNLYLAHSTLLI
jgi:hypothetical protein